MVCLSSILNSLVFSEGRPDGAGLKMAQELWKFDIPVTLVLDAAMGYCMEKVDLVLVGAEGVVESGGIINVLGTFQLAVVAKTMKKPVYVAAESYKVSNELSFFSIFSICHPFFIVCYFSHVSSSLLDSFLWVNKILGQLKS